MERAEVAKLIAEYVTAEPTLANEIHCLLGAHFDEMSEYAHSGHEKGKIKGINLVLNTLLIETAKQDKSKLLDLVPVFQMLCCGDQGEFLGALNFDK